MVQCSLMNLEKVFCTKWRDVGVVIWLERGADCLHMIQLAHPGSPGKRAVKRMCVYVCVVSVDCSWVWYAQKYVADVHNSSKCDWLTDLFIYLCIDWFIVLLISWLSEVLLECSSSRNSWLTDWLADQLIDIFIDVFIDWSFYWLIDRLKCL